MEGFANGTMIPGHGAKPKKKQKRWRDLTDEQRWEQIYSDRKKQADKTIDDLDEATRLALPSYAMYMAVENLEETGQAYLRRDAKHTLVTSLAIIASRVREDRRDKLANRLEHSFHLLKANGFFLSPQEFLYAVASATLKLVEEGEYPADAPATLSALVMVEDVHQDDSEWGLNEKHAVKAVGWVLDSMKSSGLYGLITG